jgi:hypothetical protein
MLGLSGIVLAQQFERYLHRLSSWSSISFGRVTEQIGGGYMLLFTLMLGLAAILLLPNSNGFRDRKMTVWMMLLAALLFSYAVITSFASSTEVFLYFNF